MYKGAEVRACPHRITIHNSILYSMHTTVAKCVLRLCRSVFVSAPVHDYVCPCALCIICLCAHDVETCLRRFPPARLDGGASVMLTSSPGMHGSPCACLCVSTFAKPWRARVCVRTYACEPSPLPPPVHQCAHELHVRVHGPLRACCVDVCVCTYFCICVCGFVCVCL